VVKQFSPGKRLVVKQFSPGKSLLGVVAALALTVSACSTSGGVGASSNSGAQSNAPVDTSALSAKVEAASKTPKFVMNGDPFDSSALKGKTVWAVTSSDADALPTAIKNGMSAAAQAVGVSLKFVNGEGSAATQSQGIDLAVAQHADAIVVIAVSLKDVSRAMEDAGKAGIPVIDVASSVKGGPLPAGNYQHVVVPYDESGRIMADYVVVNSKATPNILLLTGDQYASVAVRDAGILSELADQCRTCVVNKYDIQFNTLGSSAPATIATVLRKYPKTDWVIAAYDAIASDAGAAIKSNNSQGSVRLISANGNKPNLEDVRDGGVQVADVGYPSAWMGWTVMDTSMRAILKLPKVDAVVPIRMLDKASLQGIDLADPHSLFGDAYVAGYKSAWGVS